MDVEKVLRKLKPMMPREVEHWQRARQSVDAETRIMIDRAVYDAARKAFGANFEDRILLSLPPRDRIRGPFHVGTVVYDQDRWPFGLHPGELLQGLTIVGRSGSGKTNLLFHLLRQCSERKVNWVFFDWKRTGRHALNILGKDAAVSTPGRSISPLAFNPFQPPRGLESNIYLNHVIDVLAEAYTLGDGAKSILQRAIGGLHDDGNSAPTISQVIKTIDAIPNGDRVKGWKITAIRALESLRFLEIGEVAGVTQQEQVRTLLEGQTIIELNGLSSNAKRFLVPVLMLWMYQTRLAAPSREQLDLVIALDEAHNLLYRRSGRSGEPLLESLLRQCRELGMGVILADQSIHLLSPVAVGNSVATIFLNQKEPKDVAMAAPICGMDAEDRRHFPALPVGHAIVRLQDRYGEPFLVRIPKLTIEKGRMTDDELRRHVKGYLSKKGANPGSRSGETANINGSRRIPHPEAPESHDEQLLDDPLTQDQMSFMEAVVNHPDDAVRERYQRLKVGGSRGQRIQRSLIEGGWLRTQTIPVGLTRKVLLRITKRAQALLAPESRPDANETMAHAYWKRWHAKRLRDAGYRVRIEAPRFGGRIDVLGVKDGRTVGIEIETGQSDVVSNVKRGLRSGFDRLIVVATNKTALERIERQLAQSNLLISNRVSVVLQNEMDPL